MARRRRNSASKSETTEEDVEKDVKQSSSQQSSRKGASSPSGLARLKWASDPPSIATFDDTAIGAYSIFTPYGSNRITRNADSQDMPAGLVKPIVFDQSTQPNPGVAESQLTITDSDLTAEVVMNSLNRIITTPGDITINDIKPAISEYIGHCCNLVGSWAITAGLYGLAGAFGPGAGQLKNYLATIGARPWQQEAKSTLLSTIPMPPNLVNYLMQWYAVKQVPDGRSLFCVPALPSGLTSDETQTTGYSGRELLNFESEYANLLALQSTDSKDIYPELRKIFMNAGWKQFQFPNELPVVRDGMWWDAQVVNAPFAAYKWSDNNDVIQLNPQAGASRRLYSLSVYAESIQPMGERLLIPSYTSLQSAAYDRSTGAFDTSLAGAASQIGPISLGSYQFKGFIVQNDQDVYHCVPNALSLGQVPGVSQIGWSRCVGASAGSATSSWETTDYLMSLYSEMCATLLADEGTPELTPSELYEKIFLGQSTTVSSNRYKFGNTVLPNVAGSPSIINGYAKGNSGDLQRIYEYFLQAA